MSNDFWPDDWFNAAVNPAFRIQRQTFGVENGGDYVRGSSVVTLHATALRYPTTIKGYDAAEDKAFLYSRAFDYTTAEIGWGWPTQIQETWLEVCLVRSGFGHPLTVNDGQVVFRAARADFTDDDDAVNAPAPLVYDTPLQPGRWYYYSLFFKTGPLDWIIGQDASVLIPRDFEHARHLWEGLPPFYQYTDNQQREGAGFLQRMLTVFGFEMDTTREYVEQWQDLYHIDKSPVPLLKQVGRNFGFPFSGGIGETRYRGLLAALPTMLQTRGTTEALRQVVEHGSQYQAEITSGTNLLLLPDDSDFATGIGTWGNVLAATDTAEAGFADPSWPDLILTQSTAFTVPGKGRASLEIKTNKANQTDTAWLVNGASRYGADTHNPIYTSVPVEPGFIYGFSFQLKSEQTNVVVTPMLLWYSATGVYISATTATPVSPGNANFHEYIATGQAPAGATYVAAAFTLSSRASGAADPTWSYKQWLTGAMVYSLGSGLGVSLVPPDDFLTLGDAGELLGGDSVLGEP